MILNRGRWSIATCNLDVIFRIKITILVPEYQEYVITILNYIQNNNKL